MVKVTKGKIFKNANNHPLNDINHLYILSNFHIPFDHIIQCTYFRDRQDYIC